MDESLNYLLPRQDSHAWMMLTGDYVSAIMAKLCGVDLSSEEFKPGQIVQTSVARINAIVLNVSDEICRNLAFCVIALHHCIYGKC